MPTAKKPSATRKPATPKAVDTAPTPAPAPEAEASVELTPEERVAALAEAAGLRGVSPDQVDVAAARVLNRG